MHEQKDCIQQSFWQIGFGLSQLLGAGSVNRHQPKGNNYNQSAPKERRRRRAEKRLSKRMFLESPFLLCPSKVCPRGQRTNGLSKNTLLDNRFSARRLRRSFGAPPYNPNRHLMQHLYCACVVALLSATVQKALQMWHLDFPEMKTEVVVDALLRVPSKVRKAKSAAKNPKIANKIAVFWGGLRVLELHLVGWCVLSGKRVFHEGCQAQWMCQAVYVSGMSDPFSQILLFSSGF